MTTLIPSLDFFSWQFLKLQDLVGIFYDSLFSPMSPDALCTVMSNNFNKVANFQHASVTFLAEAPMHLRTKENKLRKCNFSLLEFS